MGARPSSYKTGGGFLNDVDGVIADYQFTDVAPGGENKTAKLGRKKVNADFTPLYFKLFAQADGADAVVDTHLYTGINAQDVEISEDGKTITPLEGEDISFPSNKPMSLFIASMVTEGFPEENLPEDGEPVNFEAIVGQRVRFKQQVDEKATKELGQRIGKNGGKFNRQTLIVSAVYGETETVGPVKPVKTGKKVAAKTTGKKVAGKPAKEEEDYTARAEEVLVQALNKAGGSLKRGSALSTAVTRILLAEKDENREAKRTLISSEEFLETENGWSYDSETGEIISNE